MSDRRLIEEAFPLRQASIDSVHEKNVRHGHISTLHIWPARRPLAACRAALIATLLPDPGNEAERRKLVERIGGTVISRGKGAGAKAGDKPETIGGVLHWGRENSADMDWFRAKIREAYGGRAPRVHDPFAGGGAIPLEAMRLGCAVTAADINPVAWFILKCTLEYPQRLAGRTRPLPAFALASDEFMARFRKEAGATKKPRPSGRGVRHGSPSAGLQAAPAPAQTALFAADPADTEADLAWHVRAWGWWVLQRARTDLARYYPTIDGKQTVAYLWARTVTCKSCRALLPLLKTRWLCKKEHKRVALTMTPNAERTGVDFGIAQHVLVAGGNNAQRRAKDNEAGGGTMSRAGATCPCCASIMTMEDIRLEARAGRLGAVMTAVVVDGAHGKEYRLPADEEVRSAAEAEHHLGEIFAEVPFGLPREPTPKGGSGASRAFSVDGYGFDQWGKLFTPRQLLALGTFVRHTRQAREAMRAEEYPAGWVEAVVAYLAVVVDKVADYSSSVCIWGTSMELIGHTFSRFALPMTWDLAEVAVPNEVGAAYDAQLDWTSRVLDSYSAWASQVPAGTVVNRSALEAMAPSSLDVIVTDPPYYDAIPYSDLMDFFYVWLRRTLLGLTSSIDAAFATELATKWNHGVNDGELIDDSSRFGGDKSRSKAVYEEGMACAFKACHDSLTPEGRLVIVFAHKHPDAWETLVSAIIRAGFVVDGSWPIQTERGARMRAHSSAALSSSVWLVCKKRSATARPGWDNLGLEGMRETLHGRRDAAGHWAVPSRLHQFWDAGIKGPDFVWAATGPALEAYSRHPVVRKANEPGQVMDVGEFLRAVRRLVVDFVVGRVLQATGEGGEQEAAGLDNVTVYYLLHRHDFGLESAPAGACILYAVSCNLTDRALSDTWDLLQRTGGAAAQAENDEDEGEDAGEDGAPEASAGSGSELRLKPWALRKRKTLGLPQGGRPAPLIDQAHALMHLWKAGDVHRVDDFIRLCTVKQNTLFAPVLQALIELSAEGGDERATLESIVNHLSARGSLATIQHRLIAEGS